MLPQQVLVGDLPPADLSREPWRVPVGVRESDLGPAVLCLYEGDHALVAGPARSGRSSLLAALAAGLRPASSCTQGMCGTCKTVMLDGAVDMQHNGGIRPKEVAAGKILICCSKPLSDLRIEA